MSAGDGQRTEGAKWLDKAKASAQMLASLMAPEEKADAAAQAADSVVNSLIISLVAFSNATTLDAEERLAKSLGDVKNASEPPDEMAKRFEVMRAVRTTMAEGFRDGDWGNFDRLVDKLTEPAPSEASGEDASGGAGRRGAAGDAGEADGSGQPRPQHADGG